MASSPEVLMFGKRAHLAKDISTIIAAPKRTKSEKFFKLFIDGTQYPARKIDTPRMWNKYRKKMGVPEFDPAIEILTKDRITAEELGIYVADKTYQKSKMVISTMKELRQLIVGHNRENPDDKILLQSTYEKLSENMDILVMEH
ncbi:MAG: hypothetical protein R2877_06410 [Bdellovibrionota bacterium]